MSRSQKPRKPHQRTWNSGGVLLKAQPWKIKAVLGPIEAILDQLEQEGTINTSANGTPMFLNEGDGRWYCTVSALNGVIEAYELHETRHNRQLGLEPLRLLANKLRYDTPIFESDTQAARACLVRMRLETLQMTADYAKGLVRDFQIKEALERVQGPA